MTRGERIKLVRNINGLTQAAFARRLGGGITRGAVGNWERDKGISTENLMLIGERFAAQMEWLAFERGKAPVPLTELSRRKFTSRQRDTTESYDSEDASEYAAEGFQALHSGGRHNVGEGEIPQVSARLGLGSAADADTINIPIGDHTIAALPVVATWKIPEGILRRRMVGSLKSVHIIECEGDSMEPRIHDGDFVFIDTSRRVPSPPGIFALNDGFGQTLKRLELIPNSEPPKVMIIPENPKHTSYERSLEEVSIIGRYLCRLTMD